MNVNIQCVQLYVYSTVAPVTVVKGRQKGVGNRSFRRISVIMSWMLIILSSLNEIKFET